MSLEECYSAAGADYEDVIHRFMSEERVDKFLGMFLRDKSFENLCRALEADDFEEAFRAVHTMKGICMNLSLIDLQEACNKLTENLRQGKRDEKTEEYFKTLEENYLRTTTAIRSHLE